MPREGVLVEWFGKEVSSIELGRHVVVHNNTTLRVTIGVTPSGRSNSVLTGYSESNSQHEGVTLRVTLSMIKQ